MSTITKYNRLILISSVVLFVSAGRMDEKEEALKLYADLYQSSQVSNIDWNGNIKSCKAGNLSPQILKRAENRINYFRRAVGINPITLSDTYNKLAQEATLIMTANGQLNHTPPKNWKCFSEEGAKGAKNSNLGVSDFTNFPHMAFITGFLLDYGDLNRNCGHRKWILNSRSVAMGYGNTGSYEAVYVTGVRQDPVPDPPEYIAYPPAGYFPYNLVFEKWTFSIPYGKKVDFANTRVEMIEAGGKKIPVTILSKTDPWYFDPAIVWQAESLFSAEEIKYLKNGLKEKGYVDRPITVRLTGIVIEGEKKDFEYQVIPFDPER